VNTNDSVGQYELGVMTLAVKQTIFVRGIPMMRHRGHVIKVYKRQQGKSVHIYVTAVLLEDRED
jgi:hypothetical protein